MKGQLSGEWVFILFFISILVILAFLMSQPDYPEDMKFINTFDWVWFSGGMVGIAGACVVTTGLPCAIALTIFGVVTVFKYVIVSFEWIKLLIFVPLIVTMIYIMSKLGRGGG
jgi:hypothetical protein